MLYSSYSNMTYECGTDEVGRGCIAGPVVAAAVIFSVDYKNDNIKDSKKLSEKKRITLYEQIKKDALSYSIAEVDSKKIDEINILNASFLAMHLAINKLKIIPEFIIVDGNQFKPYKNIPHKCIVKGDDKYLSIAAASILAKVYRDNLMKNFAKDFPVYEWHKNKGYPTKNHLNAVHIYGITHLHRQTFRM